MLRRRRPTKSKILFSFDSFLDVVTNIIGIIIKLILVAWVGARAYHTSMKWLEEEPLPPLPALVAPKASDDPLHGEVLDLERALAEGRAKLLKEIEQLNLTEAKAKEMPAQLTAFEKDRAALGQKEAGLSEVAKEKERIGQLVALRRSELVQRTEALRQEMKTLAALPPKRKTLRYQTPVSRAVTGAGEVHFELQRGKVTYVDLPGFIDEIKTNLDSYGKDLRDRFSAQFVTRPIGSFRVKFEMIRTRNAVEEVTGAAKPGDGENFGWFLSQGAVEPIAAGRGEPLDRALEPRSEFRQIVDSLDNLTVVTFWVYPDSFVAFRTLRDYLHGRDMEVASWPLEADGAIRFGRYGSASRGQ